MIRFFKQRLLSLGGAKASTLGPVPGDLVEEEFIPYAG